MHSDAAEVQKSIRKYLMVGATLFVFTALTVGVNQVHLGSVAANVTVALLIASAKASMVAAIFMHLSHERPWIYSVLLLTVIGFIVLLSVPMFTVMDTIGTPIHPPAAAAASHEGGH
jgi:cytochrome c oxidase subunit 4